MQDDEKYGESSSDEAEDMLPQESYESPLRPIDGTEMFSPTGREEEPESEEERESGVVDGMM